MVSGKKASILLLLKCIERKAIQLKISVGFLT